MPPKKKSTDADTSGKGDPRSGVERRVKIGDAKFVLTSVESGGWDVLHAREDGTEQRIGTISADGIPLGAVVLKPNGSRGKVGDEKIARIAAAPVLLETMSSERAYAYVPSDRAILLARLLDGEGRTPWTPPSVDCEERDFLQARELLDELVDAFTGGERETLDRVKAALMVLRGTPVGANETLAAYLTEIERAIRQTDLFERCDPQQREFFYSGKRDYFARQHDARFAQLSPKRLREALTVDVKVDPDRRGGRSKTGPRHVAAELACEVGAFGSGGDEGLDDRVAKMAARLKTAVYNAKGVRGT